MKNKILFVVLGIILTACGSNSTSNSEEPEKDNSNIMQLLLKHQHNRNDQ
jgi:outer membrane PBP1 activator LpoA protein